MVESLTASGYRFVEIVRRVREKFPDTSGETVRLDRRRVLRRWGADDSRHAEERRRRQIAALERNARECHEVGDRAGERDARWRLAQLLGMNVEKHRVVDKADNDREIILPVSLMFGGKPT